VLAVSFLSPFLKKRKSIDTANEIRLQPGQPLFQLVVGQVCRRWRGLVLLWNQLHISLQSRPSFIRLCLQSSRESPLTYISRQIVEWVRCPLLQTSFTVSWTSPMITQSWRRLFIDAYNSIPPCRDTLPVANPSPSPRTCRFLLRNLPRQSTIPISRTKRVFAIFSPVLLSLT
jgi:hypothetical protein